jgi:hypothetical protein
MELVEGFLEVGIVAHVGPDLSQLTAWKPYEVTVGRNIRQVRVGERLPERTHQRRAGEQDWEKENQKCASHQYSFV